METPETDLAMDTRTYRFRDFELDLGAHTLRMRGEPVRLERRPFELLALLVRRQGLLVPREEIIARLWPSKVVIDFDTGLNTLVRKVRQALGDSPDSPAFIETVPGVGYRFIAPVMPPEPLSSTSEEAVAAAGSSPADSAPGRRRFTVGRGAVAALLVVLVAAPAIWFAIQRGQERTSVAVLPFDNLTGNEALNYLAAGLAEETSASLAQIDPKTLRLIGSVSGRALATTGKPTLKIGRELGVDFVVASSLRAEGMKVRVSSRLVRVANDELVWTANFDREMTSLLGLQRELSGAIAEQIRLRLSPQVAAAMERRQTQSPEAYDLYLQGRYQWSLLSAASSRRAIELYDRAIAKDPDYALAWAGIAQVLGTAPITGDADPTFVRRRAREAVRHAVKSGADLTEVQYVLGHLHMILDWDWPAAEHALRRAVEIDPNNALAYLFLGHVLSQTGNQVEAQEMTRRARALDPLFSHTFAISSQVAFQGRDYPQAIELAKQAIAINPEAWVGYLQLGQAQAQIGRYAEALTAFDNAARYSVGNSKATAFRAWALAKVGRVEEARAAIADLQARGQEKYVPPYAIALIHAGLGERDAALDWLERAWVVRDIHLFFVPVDPRWDAFRDDPRFISLIERSEFCGRNGSLVAGHCSVAESAETGGDDTTAAPANPETDARLTSANIDGIWSAKSSITATRAAVSGVVTFTGPPDKTRQMGMCLVQRYVSDARAVACDTADDCDSAPRELPEGGSRYCVAPGGVGRKFCYYRPGPRPPYCAASPAAPDLPRVPPGEYRVNGAAAEGTEWLTLSCFNACAELPPLISDPAVVR